MSGAAEIIQQKRDGKIHTAEQLQWFVEGTVSGEIADYQVAAWLMAAYLNGLSPGETKVLIEAFANSGERLKFTPTDPARIDKHSTGGVGDKTSLVVAPLVASAGLLVPMISGRGLGFTGGTLDKLESIPGYRTSLPLQEFQQQVRDIGVGIIGATGEIAPADGIFYRIRDVTATADSIPLIVASILSKKVVEDLHGLVLDVKVGSGALMKTGSEARVLARALVEAGKELGLETAAVLSDMSQPLGHTIGNALEVREVLETLQGEGPADFRELCILLGGRMLLQGGQAETPEAGIQKAQELLAGGQPFESFHRMVEAQGGEVNALRDSSYLGRPSQALLKASDSGFLTHIGADKLGIAASRLGAGRRQASDSIDRHVGIVLHCKRGAAVKKGDPLATLYYNRQSLLESAQQTAELAFQIGPEPVREQELIYEVVD